MSALAISAVEAFAARQFSVFTRAQALALGVGPRSLSRCVKAGRWSRTLPGVYRVTAVPASYRQRAMAAVLWSNPDGLASHATSARFWDLEGVHSDNIHLRVPRERSLRHPDVVVHTTRDLIPADRSVAHGIPTTSALRTVLDLAETLDPLTLEIAIEDALRRRLFSIGQLRWRAESHLGPGVTGSTTIAALLRQQTIGATDSGWELRVARILTDAGLPEPTRQLEIDTIDGRRTVDLAYPGPPVVAFEYDSDQWHSGVGRRHRDAARRNALRLAGVTVIEVTSSLASDPERLVRVGPRGSGPRHAPNRIMTGTRSDGTPLRSSVPVERPVMVTPSRYPEGMGVGMPRGLSPSSFSAFKDCPLAFRFSYLDRLPQPPSAAASKGTLVHRALELLMLRKPEARTIANAVVDLDRARVELALHPDFADLDLTIDEWDGFHADAEVLVRKYFELEDPTTITPIGLELRLAATIGTVQLRGIIDRLELDVDGELVITDYKTGAVPGERYEIKRLAGVHMYAAMVEHVLGKRPVKVQLLYLSKPEAIITAPSEQSITGVMRKTDALWSAIGRACATDDFRPSTGPLCNWCSYKAYCPAYGGDPLQAVELLGPGHMIEPPLPLAAATAS